MGGLWFGCAGSYFTADALRSRRKSGERQGEFDELYCRALWTAGVWAGFDGKENAKWLSPRLRVAASPFAGSEFSDALRGHHRHGLYL
jgi:hypothetical protein